MPLLPHSCYMPCPFHLHSDKINMSWNSELNSCVYGKNTEFFSGYAVIACILKGVKHYCHYHYFIFFIIAVISLITYSRFCLRKICRIYLNISYNRHVCSCWLISCTVCVIYMKVDAEARSSVVGWGTMLQADEVDFFFNLPNPSSRSMALGSTQPLWQKWVQGIFLGDKGRPARKADNLTAICEPIV
jgi:hypothetical protein